VVPGAPSGQGGAVRADQPLEVVVENAGHSTSFEQPADFNRHVLDFIGRRAGY
jgi:pimeloyl-ACP methyl ester carboxylesterase